MVPSTKGRSIERHRYSTISWYTYVPISPDLCNYIYILYIYWPESGGTDSGEGGDAMSSTLLWVAGNNRNNARRNGCTAGMPI